MYISMTFFFCLNKSAEYWAINTFWDETFASSGVSAVVVKLIKDTRILIWYIIVKGLITIEIYLIRPKIKSNAAETKIATAQLRGKNK